MISNNEIRPFCTEDIYDSLFKVLYWLKNTVTNLFQKLCTHFRQSMPINKLYLHIHSIGIFLHHRFTLPKGFTRNSSRNFAKQTTISIKHMLKRLCGLIIQMQCKLLEENLSLNTARTMFLVLLVLQKLGWSIDAQLRSSSFTGKAVTTGRVLQSIKINCTFQYLICGHTSLVHSTECTNDLTCKCKMAIYGSDIHLTK